MRRVAALVAGVVLGGACFAACKLDLDPGLIGKKGDAGPSDGGGSGGSGGAKDAGPDATGGTGPKPDAGGCDADTQCKIDGGCVEGFCSGGKCATGMCPSQTACEGRACTAGKCAPAQSYGFGAASFTLPADVGCNTSPARCIAAFDNYVFVSTSDGKLLGWRTDDPASPTPLTLAQPSFTVNRLIASEGRLLMLSTVTSGMLDVAWIDLPADPNATAMTLTSASLGFASNPSQVHAASGDSFFLVTGTATTFFPSALLAPPISDGATLTAYPNPGVVAGASIVAASGTRLVAFRVDTSGAAPSPAFALIASAGTSNAQAGTEGTLGFEVPANLGANSFASGYDGSVLWATNRVFHDDAGTPLTNAVVLRWPLAGASANIDPTLELDLQSYPDTAATTALRGPMALIDPGTAIVSVANASNTAQSVIKVVKKTGGTLSLSAESALIDAPVSQLGMAANRKYGFALTPGASGATLYVFAPGCG